MHSLKKLKRPFVFVPMAADLFHHGHINILLKAKKYGTVIVGLMTDRGIKSYKKRSPLISFKNRKKILEQIKCVDKVIPLELHLNFEERNLKNKCIKIEQVSASHNKGWDDFWKKNYQLNLNC